MADAGTYITRRSALRFEGYELPVTFRTDYDDGTAQLRNISTSGCALHNVDVDLEVGQKVLLALALDSPAKPLSISAAVMRIDGGSIALEFRHIDDNSKRRIVLFFARETRLRKSGIAVES